MQGIYTYIPETIHVPREYGVAAILLLLFMVLISLGSVLNLLYFYISSFGIIIINIIYRSYELLRAILATSPCFLAHRRITLLLDTLTSVNMLCRVFIYIYKTK